MTVPENRTREELAALALAPARQQVYAFLGAAFSEPPSAAQLEALRTEDFLDQAATFLDENLLANLREFAHAAELIVDLESQARREFMNLFKVPGGQYVTPYESVYRDTREVAGQQVKGLLMGPSAVDVQKWYRLAALEIADDYPDLPDHIALELNYLAHLVGKERQFAADADEAKLLCAREMERDFLAGHVLPWIGPLRDKIHEKSQHAYFRSVADMAATFAEQDLAMLEESLGASAGHSAPRRPEPES